jgi:hypothetical protein
MLSTALPSGSTISKPIQKACRISDGPLRQVLTILLLLPQAYYATMIVPNLVLFSLFRRAEKQSPDLRIMVVADRVELASRTIEKVDVWVATVVRGSRLATC